MDILVYLLILGLGAASAPSYNGGYDGGFDDGFEESFGDDSFEEPSAEMPNDDDMLAEAEEMPVEEMPVEEMPAEDVPAIEPPESVSEAPADGAFVAEDQTATGRMTTATEVKPILTVTKGSWVAVREWEGQDLLYFTNLLAWRCGLHEIRYAVNNGPLQVLAAEPCYLEEGAPNALKVQDIMPFVTLGLGEVQTVSVEVFYDDLSVDFAEYTRQAIQIN